MVKTKTVIATALVLLGGLWLSYKKNWRQNLVTPVLEMPEIEHEDGIEYDFYVENETSLIYEVKLFDGFALARPANPWFYLAIRKIDLKTFATEFEPYCGNPDTIRESLKEMLGGVTIN